MDFSFSTVSRREPPLSLRILWDLWSKFEICEFLHNAVLHCCQRSIPSFAVKHCKNLSYYRIKCACFGGKLVHNGFSWTIPAWVLGNVHEFHHRFPYRWNPSGDKTGDVYKELRFLVGLSSNCFIRSPFVDGALHTILILGNCRSGAVDDVPHLVAITFGIFCLHRTFITLKVSIIYDWVIHVQIA